MKKKLQKKSNIWINQIEFKLTDGQCPIVGGSSSLSDFPYSKFFMCVEPYRISPRANSGSDLWKTYNKHNSNNDS